MRTTTAAVQGILADQYDGKTDLNQFCITASAMVDWVCAVDQNDDIRNNPTLLEQVETFLAAHFYQVADPAYKSKGVGGASGSFRGNDGMVFTSTLYGQHACAIDVSEALAKRSKEVEEGGKRVARCLWAGTEHPGRQVKTYGGY
jgi:hypothetical protein